MLVLLAKDNNRYSLIRIELPNLLANKKLLG